MLQILLAHTKKNVSCINKFVITIFYQHSTADEVRGKN